MRQILRFLLTKWDPMRVEEIRGKTTSNTDLDLSVSDGLACLNVLHLDCVVVSVQVAYHLYDFAVKLFGA